MVKWQVDKMTRSQNAQQQQQQQINQCLLFWPRPLLSFFVQLNILTKGWHLFFEKKIFYWGSIFFQMIIYLLTNWQMGTKTARFEWMVTFGYSIFWSIKRNVINSIQWKRIICKQSTKWQHLSRLKACAFLSL
jgi:hypothetical protein